MSIIIPTPTLFWDVAIYDYFDPCMNYNGFLQYPDGPMFCCHVVKRGHNNMPVVSQCGKLWHCLCQSRVVVHCLTVKEKHTLFA